MSLVAKSPLRQPAWPWAGHGSSARSAIPGRLAAAGHPGPLSAIPDSDPGPPRPDLCFG